MLGKSSYLPYRYRKNDNGIKCVRRFYFGPDIESDTPSSRLHDSHEEIGKRKIMKLARTLNHNNTTYFVYVTS